MNLTIRQWTIISVLAGAFIAAALVVARGNTGGDAAGTVDTTVDDVTWCALLQPVSAWGGILDGSAEGDDANELTNLGRAVEEARSKGRVGSRPDLARVADLILLTEVALDEGLGLGDALIEAQGQTDQDRVAEAIDRIDSELIDCGHDPVG